MDVPRSSVNEYFDHVYVINLKSRSDRKLGMLQRLAKLGISAEFFTATEGAEEDIGKAFEAYLSAPIKQGISHPIEIRYQKKMIQSRGAWAYLVTYGRLLTEAKKKGYRRILCFDDDVLFHQDFENEFKRISSQINQDWKLFYLGATQHTWNLPSTHRYADPDVLEHDPSAAFYHPLLTDGSFAVGINSSVYDELIEQINRFNCPFDSGPLRYICSLYQDQCFVAQPNLAIADVTNSDIGSQRNQYEIAEKVKWDMELYDLRMMPDLVTVIMPAYNAESTIEKSIRSILAQSYSNIEVIVADDGSTDKTVEIVKALMSEDERLRIIENAVNRGCYFVRNDAIRVARGKYIAIQDADDISIRTRIERQLIPLVSEDALFTVSRIYRSRCSMEELDIENEGALMQLVESRRIPNEQGQFEYRDRPILGFNSSMFTRSLFHRLGLFWENQFGSDAEFCERILFQLADLKLDESENIHSFLMNCEPIEGLFVRLDDVLVVSAEMGESNITSRFSAEEKKKFEQLWRARFENRVAYTYPTLEEDVTNQRTEAENQLDTLRHKCRILEQKLKVKDRVREQILEASRKRIQELEAGMAWYDRTYGHLPKWFLKIGAIFRRIRL